ncbi:hypothetical protein F4775DRAFT_70223 [Biscogniauxia sp. FL1348]|nr:hypothetical protein F4775DRAFT_70223 [Biscogniauxia sp. FL1348]
MQSYDHYSAPVSTKSKEPSTTATATTTTMFAPRPMPSQPFEYFKKRSERRPPLSRSTFTGPQAVLGPSRSAGCFLSPEEHDRRNADRSNTTWTSSSVDLGLALESEELDDDREEFVREYNQLAKKYGIRLLIRGDFPDSITSQANASKSLPNRRGSWISRVLRQDTPGTLPQGAVVNPDQRPLRHRRSISDATLNIIHQPKKDGLKDEDLTALVRLCGKSILYLPTEYAPCSLVLPTCFRALAQALVQKADSPGIFRVPGSLRVVNALYDYYCTDKDADVISSTTRCPTLPTHIKCGVHDIASTFKRFLAGLPGGILGSLSLFDALVAIHSQFHGDPELNRTKETKLRARLIALAIGTVRSRYQRDLICSVFGLLCLAGRAAENAPREDEDGRPLPTADLMGYNALGIVFGPLLIGGLINSYSMKVADPSTGLVLLPVTPPRSRKDRRHKKTKSQIELAVTSLSVDKIHIANSITEMLITNWRDVVRHMRNLGSLKTKRDSGDIKHRVNRGTVRSSASDSFPLGNPLDWNHPRPSTEGKDTTIPPKPTYPPPAPKLEHSRSWGGLQDQSDSLSIGQQCCRPSSSESSSNMLARISKRVLSPTVEESPSNNRVADDLRQKSRVVSPTPAHCVPSNSGPIYAPRTSSPPSKPSPTNENNRPASNDILAMSLATTSSGSNHSSGDVEQWKRFQPSSRDPKDLSPIQTQTNSQRNLGGPIPTKDEDQESSKENPDIGSNTSQLSQASDPLAGRRPLRYARSSELNRSSTALQLVQSKGVDEVSRYNKRLFDKQDHPHSNTYERVIGSREKASPAQPPSEGHSYHSSLEEFPRYRESTLDLGNTNNSKLLSAPPLELIPKSTKSVAKRRSFVIHRRRPSKETLTLAPRKPPSPSVWYSNKLDSGYFDMPVPKETPLEKWKALAEAGKASTESLAKSAKERRMRRNTIYGVPRQSRDTLSVADNKQMSPEWKPQPVDPRGVEKPKPLPLSPERKSIFEGAPSSPELKGNGSPSKAKTPPRANANRPLSYRSASRPVDGAVKAMAALFDTTVKDSPAGQGEASMGRTQGGLRGSKSARNQLQLGSLNSW